MASQSASRRSRRLWQLTAPVATSAIIAATLSATAAGMADAKPKPENGEGTLTATQQTAKGGDTLTINGSGFASRAAQEGRYFGVKLYTPDTQGKQVNLPADQPCEGSLQGATYMMSDPNCLPMNDSGAFTFKVKLPEELQDGQYEIRILGGQDGAPSVSKYVLFNVGEEAAASDTESTSPTSGSPTSTSDQPAEGNQPGEGTPSDNKEATLAVGDVTTAGSGQSTVTVTAAGFAPDAEVTAEVDGTPVKWSAGRGTADTTKADAQGGVNGAIVVPAGIAPAGSSHEITLKQGEKSVKSTFEAATGLTASDGTAANTKTNFTVANLPKDATVTSLKAGDTDLWTGEAKAGEDGNATIKDVTIPKDTPVDAFIVVNWKNSAEHSDTSSLKITPDNTPLNEESFTKTDTGEQITDAGFYQTAIGKDGYVFATSAVGRPPVSESAIYKLNPETLEVIEKHEAEEVQPAREDGKVSRYAVYGIGVDNTSNNAAGEPLVWVTNTRQNEISVYKQSDLSLVARSEGGALNHGRDVVVDPATGKAYASSSARGDAADGVIEVFQLEGSEGNYSIKKVETINLPEFPVTMALDFDEKEGVLYTTSLNETKAAAIHVRDGNKIDFFNLDSENAASGVAFDPVGKNLYMPTQNGNDVIVVNTVSGKTIARIPTGAQALNSVYASKNGLVYAVNRTGGTVTVLNAYDPTGEAGGQVKLANLQIGKNVNHVSVTPDGIVYVTDKDSPSKVHRIQPSDEVLARSEVVKDVPSAENNYGDLQAPDAVKQGDKTPVSVSFGKEKFWDGQLVDLIAVPKTKKSVQAVTEKAAREEAALGEPIVLASDILVNGDSKELIKADLSGLAAGDYTLVARGKHGNVLAWKDLNVTTEDVVNPGQDGKPGDEGKPGEDEKPGEDGKPGAEGGADISAEVSVEAGTDGTDQGKPGESQNGAQGGQDAQGNQGNANKAPQGNNANAVNQGNQSEGSLAKTGATAATPMILGLLAAAVIASGAVLLLRRRQS